MVLENPKVMLPGEENAKTDSQSGIYEARHQIKSGDCVVDIGANVGYWTEIACAKAGPGMVFAFEPFLQNFLLLLQRTSNWNNLICVNAAAGEHYGDRNFYEHTQNCGGHSLWKSSEHHILHTPVNGIDIGHFLTLFRIYPNFIKIDAESAEIEIVSSLIQYRLHKCPMAIECHDAFCHLRVRDLLNPTHHFTPQEEYVGVCYANPK